MLDVTVVILTKNEAQNLPDCVRSLADFAKRVVVVDSGSTDETVKVARSMGADVYEHPFENYACQFNWALDHAQITTKWSMRLDADERLTPALCRELEALALAHADDDVNGISMEAWLYFMGKIIRHGCHNKRKIMLFKTGIGRIEDRRMDEHTVLSHGTSVYTKERFIHLDQHDLSYWTRKMNWYATREMQDYIEFVQGKAASADKHSGDTAINAQRRKKFGFYYKAPMFLRCKLLFLYYYIFRLGFLDGKAGYVYNYLYHCWYRTLVDAKIMEQLQTNAPFEKTGDLK